jgi:hypothetical protein
MTKNRKQELSEKADEEQRRCREWLLKFIRADHPAEVARVKAEHFTSRPKIRGVSRFKRNNLLRLLSLAFPSHGRGRRFNPYSAHY